MLMVYKNSGVNTRYLVQNLDWYRKEHNWKERSNLFKVNSLILLAFFLFICKAVSRAGTFTYILESKWNYEILRLSRTLITEKLH